MKRLLIIVFLLPAFAYAAMVHNLYQARVPATSRSTKALQAGLQQAYHQVLVKVSGNPGVTTLPAIQQSSKQLQDIVQSYSYQMQSGTNEPSKLWLTVQFDPASIRQTLQQADQSIWSKHRPTTLIWLAYSTPQGPAIVSNDGPEDLAQTLQNNADRRGLPMLLPMMDLSDMALTTSQEIWQLKPTAIKRASQRYHVSSFLAGRIYQNKNNQWQGDWLWLMTNKQPIYWTTQGSLQQVIAKGIDNLANDLAQRYALLLSKTWRSMLKIKILNVNGLEQYHAVMQYLQHLTPVNGVQVVDVSPSDVLVAVAIAGDKQDLQQALENSHAMVPVTNTSSAPDTELIYRWNQR